MLLVKKFPGMKERISKKLRRLRCHWRIMLLMKIIQMITLKMSQKATSCQGNYQSSIKFFIKYEGDKIYNNLFSNQCKKIHFNFTSEISQGWQTFVDQVWSNFLPSTGNLLELI